MCSFHRFSFLYSWVSPLVLGTISLLEEENVLVGFVAEATVL